MVIELLKVVLLSAMLMGVAAVWVWLSNTFPRLERRLDKVTNGFGCLVWIVGLIISWTTLLLYMRKVGW